MLTSRAEATETTIRVYSPIFEVTLPFGYKTFQDSEENPGETVAKNT
jgi:hypothetical protein